MKCPFCGAVDDRVVDSRESREGEVIRRRRECESCGRRFTSYETIEEIPYMVVKKDGRREAFDRKKLRAGLVKACEKRPVPPARLDEIVDEIETLLHDAEEREIATSRIGGLSWTGCASSTRSRTSGSPRSTASSRTSTSSSWN